MSPKVYLDYNATTPLHPEILESVTNNIKSFGNASSIHWAGRDAKKLITGARRTIAEFLHCDPLEIIFTSGGSEGNNLALKGALKSVEKNRTELVCSDVEHPSVLKTMEFLKSEGYKIRKFQISRDGEVNLENFSSLLTENTALVSCQLVNNETGQIFPVKKMAKLAHNVGALFHSDMVQALGKIPVDLGAMDVDFATFAGHKFYALKGAGFLYAKKGLHLEPLIHGGGQERNRRAGTENALAISSLGDAVRILGPRLEIERERLEKLRDHLEVEIVRQIPSVVINGKGGKRVGNTLNVGFAGTDGETLLINLDTRGFAVSSGAACSSGSQEPSPVLKAMGLSASEAAQSLRISLGWMTTEQEVHDFLKVLVEVVKDMRTIHDNQDTERELA